MTLYILRHGQTELNRLGIVQGSGVDAGLNEVGYAQARAFFQAHQHVDFELVITSKLCRTHQTVQGFLDKGIPWEQKEDINEISWGIHEGQPQSPEQNRRYHEMIAEWKSGNLDACIPGGESAQQLLSRIKQFVDWVGSRPERRILIATHGRAIRCLITCLKGLPPTAMEDMEHSNTGLYLVHFKEDKWVFELENDISHLG